MPHQIHNTNDRCRYDKDGKPTSASAGKPSGGGGGKKPYKKFGGDGKGMAYMSAIFETFLKNKKGKRSKKRKKCSYDSSSDSDSE